MSKSKNDSSLPFHELIKRKGDTLWNQQYDYSLIDLIVYFLKHWKIFLSSIFIGISLGFLITNHRTLYKTTVTLQTDQANPLVLNLPTNINAALLRSFGENQLLQIYETHALELMRKMDGSHKDLEESFSDYIHSEMHTALATLAYNENNQFAFLFQSAPSGVGYSLTMNLPQKNISRPMVQILSAAFNDMITEYNATEWKRRNHLKELKKEQIQAAIDLLSKDYLGEIVEEYGHAKLQTSSSFFQLEREVLSLERKFNVKNKDFDTLTIPPNPQTETSLEYDSPFEALQTYSFLRKLSKLEETAPKKDLEPLKTSFTHLDTAKRNHQVKYFAQKKSFLSSFEDLQKRIQEVNAPIDKSQFSLPSIDMKIFEDQRLVGTVGEKISSYALPMIAGSIAGLILGIFLTFMQGLWILVYREKT